MFGLKLALQGLFWCTWVWGQKLILFVREPECVCVWVESFGDCQAVVVETRGHRWPLTWGLMKRCRRSPLSVVVMVVVLTHVEEPSDNGETIDARAVVGDSVGNHSCNLGIDYRRIQRWWRGDRLLCPVNVCDWSLDDSLSIVSGWSHRTKMHFSVPSRSLSHDTEVTESWDVRGMRFGQQPSFVIKCKNTPKHIA